MRLLPLLLTVFIDSFGFGLVFPMLSPLIMDPQQGILPLETSLTTRGLLFGILVSAFCVGQFFGGPVLGTISDRKGRKKVLLATIGLAFLTYLMAAGAVFYQNVVVLLVARLLGGAAASNWTIAQTIIVDGSTEENKAKNFGMLGMTWGMGFIIGPFLGGKLSDPRFFLSHGLATPFVFAALMCAINIALVWRGVKESLPEARIAKISLLVGIEHLKKAFSHPQLKGLFLVIFLFSLGWGFFTEFIPIFLMRRLDFNVSDIANFFAYVGICIAFSQGVLGRFILSRFKPHQLLPFALCALGCVVPFMVFFNEALGIYALLPFVAFFESLIHPTASTIVSNLTSKEAQGEILGIYNSIQWAAIGICPFFSGSFVAHFPSLPPLFAGMMMLVAMIVYLRVGRKTSASPV